MKLEKSWEFYGMNDNRGLRVYAELVVYLLQRSICACGKHISSEKAFNMLNNWPGSPLTPVEEKWIHYFYGKLCGTHFDTLLVSYMLPQLDLGMGADYNIHKIEVLLHSKLDQASVEIKQCNPNAN